MENLKINKKAGLKDEYKITSIAGGYIVERYIINEGKDMVKLTELQAELTLDFGTPERDYFYANENARIYGSFTIPVDYDRENLNNPKNKKFVFQADTFWADPKVVGRRILASPYQPFPAILLSNYDTEKGVIIGSLSQEVFL